jgi:hypothetical protein
LETTGIVIIFIVFILLQRQDLRNRLVRLAGSRDLQRTTAAIDDAVAYHGSDTEKYLGEVDGLKAPWGGGRIHFEGSAS